MYIVCAILALHKTATFDAIHFVISQKKITNIQLMSRTTLFLNC